MKHDMIPKSLAVILLVAGLLATAKAQQLVTFDFSILDSAGKFVPNLKPEDFHLLVGKQLVPLSALESADRRLEVFVLIDVSVSQEKVLPNEKLAVERFVDGVLLPDRDILAIAKFSGDIKLVQDSTHEFEKAKSSLRQITFEPPAGYIGGGIVQTSRPPAPNSQGSTSVWDTVIKASDALSKAGDPNARKLILLVSDGVSTYGDARLKEAVIRCVRNNTPVFAIGIADEDYDPVDIRSLRRVSDQTGGMSIIPKRKGNGLEEQIASIKDAVRNTYRAQFTQNPTPAGTLNEVKVEVVNSKTGPGKWTIIQPLGFILQ